MAAWGSLLNDILVRLASQIAADSATALPDIVLNEGIQIGNVSGAGTVFEGPGLTIWPESWTYEAFDSESDWGRASIAFTLGRLVTDIRDPRTQAGLIRQDVGRLRGWLVEHRNLGDASNTAGSALVQDSMVESVETALEDLGEHGQWQTARLLWAIQWLEPRDMTDYVPITDTIVGATVTDSEDVSLAIEVVGEEV